LTSRRTRRLERLFFSPPFSSDCSRFRFSPSPILSSPFCLLIVSRKESRPARSPCCERPEVSRPCVCARLSKVALFSFHRFRTSPFTPGVYLLLCFSSLFFSPPRSPLNEFAYSCLSLCRPGPNLGFFSLHPIYLPFFLVDTSAYHLLIITNLVPSLFFALSPRRSKPESH